jgi:hypothetical protein
MVNMTSTTLQADVSWSNLDPSILDASTSDKPFRNTDWQHAIFLKA